MASPCSSSRLVWKGRGSSCYGLTTVPIPYSPCSLRDSWNVVYILSWFLIIQLFQIGNNLNYFSSKSAVPVIAIGENIYCDYNYETIITIIISRYSMKTVRFPQVTVMDWPRSLLMVWKQILFLWVILCCCISRAFLENTVVSDRRLQSEIISPLGTNSDASCLDTGCSPWKHTVHGIQFLWFYRHLIRYFYVDRKDRGPEGDRHLLSGHWKAGII